MPVQWHLPRPEVQAVLQVTGAAVARSSSFAFTQPFTSLQNIAQAGTVIATDNSATVKTPHDNCVLVMPSIRQLRPGVTTVRFARTLPGHCLPELLGRRL
jgi:hypothetical protein